MKEFGGFRGRVLLDPDVVHGSAHRDEFFLGRGLARPMPSVGLSSGPAVAAVCSRRRSFTSWRLSERGSWQPRPAQGEGGRSAGH